LINSTYPTFKTCRTCQTFLITDHYLSSMFPSYSYPRKVTWGLAASVLFGLRRSFRLDGQACVGRLKPPLRVTGEEHIPRSGPCLVIFNHYFRPGFNAWWMALAIAAVVPQDIHFIMTGELTYPGRWYAPLGRAGSRWLLKRISHTYGFTLMPPMPPRPQDVEARARSVRAALAYIKAHPGAFVALAPEGGDQPGGLLSWPPSGTGRFIALLAPAGRPVLPVGVYEDSGCLCLNIGEPYSLSIPPGLPTGERDRHVAARTMRSLARLLPARLQGDFA
jgi:1-acyl-sn-glycerol-3-phosphate acyltransferase